MSRTGEQNREKRRTEERKEKVKKEREGVAQEGDV